MANNLTDLRNQLFETLQTLKESKPVALEMEIKRATAVRLVAEQLIETAKVEVSLRKVLKRQPASEFFDVPELTDGGEQAGAPEKMMRLAEKVKG